MAAYELRITGPAAKELDALPRKKDRSAVCGSGPGLETREPSGTRLGGVRWQCCGVREPLTRRSAATFVVFGSFVTEKREPNDVDIFMIMDDTFEYSRVEAASRLLFEHGSAQDYFGCSAFWVRSMSALGGEQAAMESWQIKRDGAKQGIVEVIGDQA